MRNEFVCEACRTTVADSDWEQHVRRVHNSKAPNRAESVSPTTPLLECPHCWALVRKRRLADHMRVMHRDHDESVRLAPVPRSTSKIADTPRRQKDSSAGPEGERALISLHAEAEREHVTLEGFFPVQRRFHENWARTCGTGMTTRAFSLSSRGGPRTKTTSVSSSTRTARNRTCFAGATNFTRPRSC